MEFYHWGRYDLLLKILEQADRGDDERRLRKALMLLDKTCHKRIRPVYQRCYGPVKGSIPWGSARAWKCGRNPGPLLGCFSFISGFAPRVYRHVPLRRWELWNGGQPALYENSHIWHWMGEHEREAHSRCNRCLRDAIFVGLYPKTFILDLRPNWDYPREHLFCQDCLLELYEITSSNNALTLTEFVSQKIKLIKCDLY
jgi:hypothetical protein